MSAESIEWHLECLANQKRHLVDAKNELARNQLRVQRLEIDTDFYERRINQAVAAGKMKFDSERFSKRRSQAGE